MGIKKIIANLLSKVVYKLSHPKSVFTRDLLIRENYNIGEYTYGYPRVLFKDEGRLVIGKFCSISENVKIFLGGNHRTDWISTYPFNVLFNEHPVASKIKGHPTSKGDVIIGNDVWIAYGVTIMSGVRIGDGAVVAAQSVVTKNIGPYEIWAGNPARLIKKRFSEKEIERLLSKKWWNWPIKKILDNSNKLCKCKIEDVLNF